MSSLAATIYYGMSIGLCLCTQDCSICYVPCVWQLGLTDFYWDCIQGSLSCFVYSQLKYVSGLAATIYYSMSIGLRLCTQDCSICYVPCVWQLSLTDFYWNCIQGSLSCFIYGQCQCISINHATAIVSYLINIGHRCCWGIRLTVSSPCVRFTLTDSLLGWVLICYDWLYSQLDSSVDYEVTTCLYLQGHCMLCCIAIQFSISTSNPLYVHYISNCLCVVQLVVCFDCINCTCYIYCATRVQCRQSTWDCSQQILCHYLRSYGWNDHEGIDAIASQTSNHSIVPCLA